MTCRRYSLMAAVIFAILAVMQLARAILGWSVDVTTPWGALAVPLWPNWLACAVLLYLAWLGFTASRRP
jgi:hypothetical protein